MELSGLLTLLEGAAPVRALLAALAQPGPLRAGVPDAARPPLIAALARAAGGALLVVTPRPDRAQRLAEEVPAWLGGGRPVLLLPERDPLPYERLPPDPEAVSQRLRALDALATGEPGVVVAAARAAAQRTLGLRALRTATLRLSAGDAQNPEGLAGRLVALGYDMAPVVDRVGVATRRGGIVDFFPPTAASPLRVEFLGDRVESLREFAPASQRSRGRVEAAAVGPAREYLPRPPGVPWPFEGLDLAACAPKVRDRWETELELLRAGQRFDGDDFYGAFLGEASVLDYLPASGLLIVDEPAEVEEALREFEAHAAEVRADLEARGELPAGVPLPFMAAGRFSAALGAHERRLELSRWAGAEPETPLAELRAAFGAPDHYGGRLSALTAELRRAAGQGHTLVVVSQQAARLAELLREEGVAAEPVAALRQPLRPGEVRLVHGSLAEGWVLTGSGPALSLLTDTEVFGFTKQRRAIRRRVASPEAFLAGLSAGDYVVHVEHGIARFGGTVRLSTNGRAQEYLELRYAGDDKLYVPLDQVDRVSRYVGPSDHTPTLNRLGSADWVRTKARVRRAVAELAQELLNVHAARELSEGHAFSPDTPWQLELEAAFPYVETPDQLEAVRAVKRDMEEPRPMDRLVLGDVGYGKTEVAVRAAFKAVMEGRQVAVLVPTTVLAQQHLRTFCERLASFPVRVEMLSRFRSPREQREVAEALAGGKVEIVIGTHRLLQKDVAFKDLGLVIIDEEQRFGVAHKERLKRMRREVDVLTLSATPIPRTLHMSLTGIREMSTMETPPEERLPIKTYVAEFDEKMVREAILRELERGGQVYFVHNRVQGIELVARRVAELVPEAIVGIAHGQMPEEQLERTMLDFARGGIDVLVCTTIIESGLDIPNVNTIIIHRADRFGLAQLYQLRGRVGRGAHRAYAYLLYDRRQPIGEAAQKRLQTIFEAQELGAGFQIALRDLEIRGAGNLLGAEQSGHIGAVGFELYTHLLAEAVEQLKALQRGEPPPRPRSLEPPVTVDLPVVAQLPEGYVPDLNLRLGLYHRLASVEDPAAVDDLAAEMGDRFGPPPPAARQLLYVVRLKALGRVARLRGIKAEGSTIILQRAEDAPLNRALIRDLPRGAQVGHTQLRLDKPSLGPRWQEELLRVVSLLAERPAPAAVRPGVTR